MRIEVNSLEDALRMQVMRALKEVMVPDENASVYDLNLVQLVEIDEEKVRLVFHPQAMLCTSMQLAFSVRSAVKSVTGARRVEIHVADYIRACVRRGDVP